MPAAGIQEKEIEQREDASMMESQGQIMPPPPPSSGLLPLPSREEGRQERQIREK